jgi:hypothetical protein
MREIMNILMFRRERYTRICGEIQYYEEILADHQLTIEQTADIVNILMNLQSRANRLVLLMTGW